MICIEWNRRAADLLVFIIPRSKEKGNEVENNSLKRACDGIICVSCFCVVVSLRIAVKRGIRMKIKTGALDTGFILQLVLQDDGALPDFLRQRRRKRPSDWFADDERGAAVGTCLCPIDKNEMCTAERINQTGRRIDDE